MGNLFQQPPRKDDPAAASGLHPDAVNAAAASFVLVLMTLGMNGLAIWLRYRLRKNIKW